MSTHLTDPAAPAVPADARIDADDDVNWHDLQNAQMLSMQGVLDNPEDEVWNSTTSDADGVARTARRAQLRQAQAMFRQVMPADAPSLVDELIAERRAESARE